MFPTPVAKWKPVNRALYKLSLPVALLIWLLPLIAVMVTSIRSSDELVMGNYWGWPRHFSLIANYSNALTTSPIDASMRPTRRPDDRSRTMKKPKP